MVCCQGRSLCERLLLPLFVLGMRLLSHSSSGLIFELLILSSQVVSFVGDTVCYLKCPIVVFDTRTPGKHVQDTEFQQSEMHAACLLTRHDPTHLKTIIWLDYVRYCNARV